MRWRRCRWCGSTRCPAKAADLDAMLRWNVRKSLPFKIEDAQVTYGEGVAAMVAGGSSSSPLPGAI